jgi:hypothetical protein
VHSVSEFLLVTTLITSQLHQDSIHRGNVALRKPTQRKKIDRPNWQHLVPIRSKMKKIEIAMINTVQLAARKNLIQMSLQW